MASSWPAAGDGSLRVGDPSPWNRCCLPRMEAISRMALPLGAELLSGVLDCRRSYAISLGARWNTPRNTFGCSINR
jgi:hypothetical protein